MTETLVLTGTNKLRSGIVKIPLHVLLVIYCYICFLLKLLTGVENYYCFTSFIVLRLPPCITSAKYKPALNC